MHWPALILFSVVVARDCAPLVWLNNTYNIVLKLQELQYSLSILLAAIWHNALRSNIHVVEGAAEVLAGQLHGCLHMRPVIIPRREQATSQHIALCSAPHNPSSHIR